MRFELSLFRDLMENLESSWRRQWHAVVMCSDANMTGCGFTGPFGPREVVSLVGHTSERSRFHHEGSNARDHAFRTAFPEPVDPYVEYLRPPQEDAPDELWMKDPNFPEVPDQYLRLPFEAQRSWEMGTQGRHPCSGVKSAPLGPFAGFSFFPRNFSAALVFGA